MFKLDIVHSDIPFLSAFPDKEIVRQLLAGVRGFPAYDDWKVKKATDLIVCDFFRKGVQVAIVRAGSPRLVQVSLPAQSPKNFSTSSGGSATT
jgi:hypothetical protein